VTSTKKQTFKGKDYLVTSPFEVPFDDLIEKQDAFREIFDNVIGEKILEDLAQHCHIRNANIPSNKSDQQMWINAGMGMVYWYIYNLVHADIKEIEN